MKTRARWVNRASWVGCGVLTFALLIGLDPYRRPYIERAYGPYLREYFQASLEMASNLQTAGRYTLRPEGRWHLFRGWEDQDTSSESSPQRARGRARRVHLLAPSGRSQPLRIRLDVAGLPDSSRDPRPVVVEYGVNGISAGRFQLPAEGPAVLSFEVPASSVFRGDNVVFLYRLTRRATPTPWLSLGAMEVSAAGPEDDLESSVYEAAPGGTRPGGAGAFLPMR